MLCANCGAEEGTPKAGHRGSVSLSLAEWLPDKGLVLWCSRRCRDEWWRPRAQARPVDAVA